MMRRMMRRRTRRTHLARSMILLMYLAGSTLRSAMSLWNSSHWLGRAEKMELSVTKLQESNHDTCSNAQIVFV